MTYSRITFLRQNFRREGAKRGEIFSRESQGTRGKNSSPRTKVQRIGFNFYHELTNLFWLCRLLGWVKPL
ncbi:MAG: hypothetical protein EORIYHIE_003459 [Candidatus Fervidibacter sp.]